MTEPTNPVTLIENQAKFEALCRQLMSESVIGLDVETTLDEMPDLCTIQMATKRQNFIVDVLAIKDLTPCHHLFGARSIVKVIHYAAFERKVLRQYGVVIRNVFDTCEVSRDLHFRANGGHSLLAVCRRELGIELDKYWQTSDWTKRPLDPQQIDYAAMDAEVLVKLYDIFMEEKMKRAGQPSLLSAGPIPNVRVVVPKGPGTNSAVNLSQLKLEDVMVALRKVFRKDEILSADETIRKVAKELGFFNVDGKTAAVLRGFLSRGMKNRIVDKIGDEYKRVTSTVYDYEPKELTSLMITFVHQNKNCSRLQIVQELAKRLGFPNCRGKEQFMLQQTLERALAAGKLRESTDGSLRKA